MTESMLGQMAVRRDVRITSLASKSSVVFAHDAESVRLPWRTDRIIGRLAGDALHPALQFRHEVDVWWYPKGIAPPIVGGRTSSVGFIADSIVAHYATNHPKSRSRFDFAYWLRQLRRSLQWFDRVQAPTESARGQLLECCERWGIEGSTITVTGEGSDWERFRGQPVRRSDHVVHLAAAAPHKRTNALLAAWTRLEAAGRDLPRLVLVGHVDDAGVELVRSSRSIELLGRRLVVEELREVVATATALLLPSSIEGFGLPALEAGYVGTPVLFTPGTSVEEVVGPLGSWGGFELEDPDALEVALHRASLASDAQLRAWADDLYERFSLDLVTRRVVDELRIAAAG